MQTSDDGADFEEPHVSAPIVDGDAVRAAFGQLTRGLMALHAARKLHRDIKPPNILVAHDGRVVVLDFGLVVEEDRDLHALLGQGAGTPAFMSPEQSASRSLTPSSDWYSVGATLHAVLTGAPPRSGASLRTGDAPTPNAPEDLIALCRRLIDPNPELRPGGREILDVLGVAPDDPRTMTGSRPPASALLGRDEELAALDEALAATRRAPVLLRIVGEAGVGKTALVEQWLTGVSALEPDAWVLHSRCLEHELIPFKAIDGIIDALVARLLREPMERRSAMLPADATVTELLMRMFPVLAGLMPAALEPPHDDASAEPEVPVEADPRVMRDRALAGLRELFERVAAQHRLILHIDDAHWGDADSARVLADLMASSSTALLLVVGQRPTRDRAAMPAMLAEWLAHARAGLVVRDIVLAELDAASARSLARECLHGDDGLAERVAHQAGGSPFVIRQMAAELRDTASDAGGRVAEVALSNLLDRQLDRMPPHARRIIEVLSLAARPLPEEVAARAAGVALGDVRPAVRAAERSRLVASANIDGAHHLETGHARIREGVARALDADVARGHHLAIADSLLAFGRDEPETLLPHFIGGGDKVRASRAAMQSAQHAEQAFAFERAADLYGLILDLGLETTDRGEILERRGDAWSNAGRSADAAESLHAALAARPHEGLDADQRRARRTLRRRCGELWLRSGYVSKGSACLSEVLAELEIAMPATEKDALRMAMWRRLRLLVRGMKFTPRPERDVPPATLERLDAMWGVTTSLVMLRFLIADSVGLQHLLEALEVGEPTRVLRALALEVSFEALLGGSFFDARCRRMLAQMDRVAEGFSTPYFRAWSTMCRGVAGWLRGDWQTSWTDCRSAATVYASQSRGLVWELAVCDVYGLSAATYLGRFADLAAAVPESYRSARERGDLYATANLAFYESFLLLARDEPGAAIQCMRDAIEPFLHEQFLANRYGIDYAIIQGELYRDDPEAAWAIVEREWKSWETIGMVRVQCVRVEVRYLRARVAAALIAKRGPGLTAKTARAARGALREDTRKIAGDAIAPAAPLALALRAALANIDGGRDEAVSLLRDAARGFDRCGMTVHAGAARHHIASRTKSAADLDVAARDAQRLSGEGVARPDRMFHLTIPGFSRGHR